MTPPSTRRRALVHVVLSITSAATKSRDDWRELFDLVRPSRYVRDSRGLAHHLQVLDHLLCSPREHESRVV